MDHRLAWQTVTIMENRTTEITPTGHGGTSNSTVVQRAEARYLHF
jgi:hypothetical protein